MPRSVGDSPCAPGEGDNGREPDYETECAECASRNEDDSQENGVLLDCGDVECDCSCHLPSDDPPEHDD